MGVNTQVRGQSARQLNAQRCWGTWGGPGCYSLSQSLTLLVKPGSGILGTAVINKETQRFWQSRQVRSWVPSGPGCLGKSAGLGHSQLGGARCRPCGQQGCTLEGIRGPLGQYDPPQLPLFHSSEDRRISAIPRITGKKTFCQVSVRSAFMDTEACLSRGGWIPDIWRKHVSYVPEVDINPVQFVFNHQVYRIIIQTNFRLLNKTNQCMLHIYSPTYTILWKNNRRLYYVLYI